MCFTNTRLYKTDLRLTFTPSPNTIATYVSTYHQHPG
jgi:hypothetical protein